MQPEYLHVLLNPLPVYGLLMGCIALAMALLLRSRVSQIVALVLIFFCSASALPVFLFGQQAYKEVRSISDGDGQAWLDEHMERAEKGVYAYYALAAVALLAMTLPRKFPRTEFKLALVTLVLAVGALGVGGWISYAGGKIRHTEFRTTPAPQVEHHHHEHGHEEH